MITWYGRCVRAEEQVEEYVSVSSAVTTKGKKKGNLLFTHKTRLTKVSFYAVTKNESLVTVLEKCHNDNTSLIP